MSLMLLSKKTQSCSGGKGKDLDILKIQVGRI